LDYISSTGAEAFDDLESVTEILGDFVREWRGQNNNKIVLKQEYAI
jgi:hypothetical protein